MTAKIELRKMLKQTDLKESTTSDSLFAGLPEQNESEMRWVKLHQMFDR